MMKLYCLIILIFCLNLVDGIVRECMYNLFLNYIKIIYLIVYIFFYLKYEFIMIIDNNLIILLVDL